MGIALPLAASAILHYFQIMSLEQLKREVTALSDREQAELIRYTVQLRHANDSEYRREVTDRLNDKDKSHWLTPDEFERRLDYA
jgi:hypothetical protein